MAILGNSGAATLVEANDIHAGLPSLEGCATTFVPRRSSLAVFVPQGRRAALARRFLAHLNEIPPSRRRVAILNGAKELPTTDVLARLRDVADTTLLDVR
jgi:hypothetical protein